MMGEHLKLAREVAADAKLRSIDRLCRAEARELARLLEEWEREPEECLKSCA